jgi:hypothetical protein
VDWLPPQAASATSKTISNGAITNFQVFIFPPERNWLWLPY